MFVNRFDLIHALAPLSTHDTEFCGTNGKNPEAGMMPRGSYHRSAVAYSTLSGKGAFLFYHPFGLASRVVRGDFDTEKFTEVDSELNCGPENHPVEESPPRSHVSAEMVNGHHQGRAQYYWGVPHDFCLIVHGYSLAFGKELVKLFMELSNFLTVREVD